jgi:hypothetical protein
MEMEMEEKTKSRWENNRQVTLVWSKQDTWALAVAARADTGRERNKKNRGWRMKMDIHPGHLPRTDGT